MKKTLLITTILASSFLSAQIEIASDINQGNFGSSIEDVFEFKNNLFFSAEINDKFSGSSERKLWKTDGTEAGTFQVENLPPEHYFPSENAIYFTTNFNREVWKTDGTEAGTAKIYDGNGTLDPLGSYKDFFYFVEQFSATEIGVFKTNGTETTKILTFPEDEAARSGIFNDNNALFKFNENKFVFLIQSKSSGTTAYISDGTENGTELMHNSTKGALSQVPLFFNNLSNITVYTDNLKRVWATDGTLNRTNLIKTFTGSNSRRIHSMIPFNGKVYFGFLFTADFWETDGTEAGTKALFNNIGGDGNVQGIEKLGSNLIILLERGIYLFDGTKTTKLDLPDLTYINRVAYEKAGDKLYFTGNYKGQGDRIWITDGTENGTYSLDPFWPDNKVPANNMHALNNKLIFTLSGSNAGYNTDEPWVTDGTNAGTKLLKDINKTGNLDAKPKFQTELNGKIYFAADDNIHGRELFVFDGTNTSMVKDIYPGFSSSNPYDFHKLGNKIIFKAFTLDVGLELWITDGTETGTQLLKDINPTGDGFLNDNRAFVRINQFKEHNNELYFYADNGTNGMELWKTNGTEAGTIMLKDINPGFNASYRPALDGRPRFVAHDNELYFYVSSSGSSNNLSNFQMWKTDGTPSGTVKIDIIENTIKEGTILPLTYFSFNNQFYFYGEDKTTRKDELFRTDFTTVTKIEGLGRQNAFYPLKEKIYYRDNNRGSEKGNEIWAVDKNDNFAIVKDIVDGSQGSNPGDFYTFKDFLYFSVRNSNFRTELWRLSDNTAPEKIFSVEDEPNSNSIEQYYDYVPKEDHLFINTKHNGNSEFRYRMYAIKNNESNLTPALSINSFDVFYENTPNGIKSLSTFLDNKFYFTGNISEEGEELLVAGFDTVLRVDDFNLNTHNSDFKIFPNPVNNILNIDSSSDIKSVKIYNILGKEILKTKSKKINVSKLNSGIYILKLENNLGEVSTKKWIKNSSK